jgi:hypothetical protein
MHKLDGDLHLQIETDQIGCLAKSNPRDFGATNQIGVLMQVTRPAPGTKQKAQACQSQASIGGAVFGECLTDRFTPIGMRIAVPIDCPSCQIQNSLRRMHMLRLTLHT